jgi:hypothetical protein
MSRSLRIAAEECRIALFGDIGANFTPMGVPLINPARLIVIQNTTDVELEFSLDGVNMHIPLPSNGTFTFDIATNKANESGWYMAEGSRLYVRAAGALPASGRATFSVFYGE